MSKRVVESDIVPRPQQLAEHSEEVVASQSRCDAQLADREKHEQQGDAAAPQPELVRKPFEAPLLPEPRAPEPATVPDALATLSLDQMRDLLLATATEFVPATSVRLGGQFVDAGTGLTIATVDATLVLPTGSGRTEAGMLRELMLRLAR